MHVPTRDHLWANCIAQSFRSYKVRNEKQLKNGHYSYSMANGSFTGSTYGLKVTLNIQDYEYMAGPYTDAGIKVMHNCNLRSKYTPW